MAIQILVLVLLPALLIAAAVCDVTSFKIPNIIPALLVLLYAIFVVLTAMQGSLAWSELGSHLLAGVIALAASLVLFALGWIGGGDAKFFAAIALWLGYAHLLDYAIAAAILGGGLTVAILAFRQMLLPRFFHQLWISRLADKAAGIPYGIALAAAAFFILPHCDFFRAAMAI